MFGVIYRRAVSVLCCGSLTHRNRFFMMHLNVNLTPKAVVVGCAHYKSHPTHLSANCFFTNVNSGQISDKTKQ